MPKEETKESAAEPAPAAEEGPEIGQMPKGDYMIHVFIEEGRKIICEEDDAADPIIEITVFEEKKFTKSFDDVGPNAQVAWNEHVFFEPRDLSQD